jgi:hypothetical protein
MYCVFNLKKKLQLFLIIEPFLLIIITFAGIYYLWTGIIWMRYIIFASSLLMTLVYFASASIVLYQCIFVKK